ncbi:MAG: hypothetical protein WCU88_04775 [Elusimicrobiota bacterium]|jgi:hypothetical protein
MIFTRGFSLIAVFAAVFSAVPCSANPVSGGLLGTGGYLDVLRRTDKPWLLTEKPDASKVKEVLSRITREAFYLESEFSSYARKAEKAGRELDLLAPAARAQGFGPGLAALSEEDRRFLRDSVRDVVVIDKVGDPQIAAERVLESLENAYPSKAALLAQMTQALAFLSKLDPEAAALPGLRDSVRDMELAVCGARAASDTARLRMEAVYARASESNAQAGPRAQHLAQGLYGKIWRNEWQAEQLMDAAQSLVRATED